MLLSPPIFLAGYEGANIFSPLFSSLATLRLRPGCHACAFLPRFWGALQKVNNKQRKPSDEKRGEERNQTR